MATYLQGVTDYIPQIQPFSPDYNFYSGALDLKQSKYDAARKQLSNLYGSLLNAPLTRDDNAASRDKFFKTIEQDIQKMATMDLSLRQNQEAAAGVFNQLLDNKNIVKDMVWTKNYQSQVKRSEGFKNCVDPEKCGGQWWQGGDQLLDYSRLEFKNASADEAMYFADAEYVPYQDITKRAIELAKEADLNVSLDNVTGQWITTTKNGPLIQKPLSDLFMGAIGSDPKVQEYYTAKARLQRKNFMYGNKDQYGSLEAAEQAYIEQMAPSLEKALGIKGAQLEEEVTNNEKKQQKIQEKMNNSIEEDQKTMAEVYDELENRKNAYDKTLDKIKSDQQVANTAKTKQKYSGSDIDSLYASFDLQSGINGLAETLSMKDYEFSVKENPYGLEAVKQANRMALEQMRFEHDRVINYEKFQQEVALYESGYKGGGGGAGGAAGVPPAGTTENNLGETVVDVAGATDVGSGDKFSFAQEHSGYRKFKEDYEGTRTDLSSNEKYLANEVTERTKTAALNGDVQAKEDYVKLFSDYLFATDALEGGLAEQESGIMGAATRSVAKARKATIKEAMRNANTIDEKFSVAQRFGIDLSQLKGEQMDAYYKSTVKNLYDPSDKTNLALRGHLSDLWESTRDIRAGIQAKDIALEQMNKYVGEQNREIASKTASKYGKFWGDAIESYVDTEGNIVSKDTFIDNMQSRGHSANAAEEVWRGNRLKTYDDASAGEVFQAGAESVGSYIWEIGRGVGTLGLDYIREGWSPEGFSENLNEAAAGGKAQPGIHDFYKARFSEYAKPTAEGAMFGLQGLGETSGMGVKYQLDAAAYRSVATTGAIGFLKDALNNKDAKFEFGGFGLSYDNDDNAKRFAQEVYQSLIRDKGKDRILGDVTYTHVAGGDKNKVALNIKVPESFAAKFKGSEDSPGPTRAAIEQIALNGFTVVMDKSATDNVFTRGATRTPYETTMQYRGQIDFDQNPNYTKDLKLVAQDGKYVLTGSMISGIDENGNRQFDVLRPTEFSMQQDLNDIIANIDAKVQQAIVLGKMSEQEYLNNRR